MNTFVWIVSRLFLFALGLYYGVEQARNQHWTMMVAVAAVTAVAMVCPCRFAVVARR